MARITDPSLTLEKVRAALGALGLTGSLPLQQIGSLSGGEKARVALAVFALVPANVLLLDEASNHLDAATLEVLTGGEGWWGFVVCGCCFRGSGARRSKATCGQVSASRCVCLVPKLAMCADCSRLMLAVCKRFCLLTFHAGCCCCWRRCSQEFHWRGGGHHA